MDIYLFELHAVANVVVLVNAVMNVYTKFKRTATIAARLVY